MSTLVKSVVRTIYGDHLNTTRAMKRPFSVLPNSTLNQKFNLYPDEVPAINEYPSIGYLAIGNKGADYEVTPTGYVLTTPRAKEPSFSSLYGFIPFVVRNINDDLSPTERLLYRLRVPTIIDGTTYVAYYLRTLSLDTVIPTVERRNVSDGIITTTAFVPSLSDLSPTPPNISNANINNPDGDYLVSTAKVSFQLNQQDIQNIMDGCAILYGDPRYAVISEIAVVTGVDKVLSGTFGGATSSYMEVIAAQVAVFISQYHALSTNTTGVDILLDVGAVEPLLLA